MIHVLVAASSAVARAGLEAILARDPSILVVGSERGDDATSLGDEISEHEPDVVLVERPHADDVLGRGTDASDVGATSGTMVLLTDEENPSRIAALLAAGARALLPRDAGVAEILAAVQGAAAGLVSLPASWMTMLLPPGSVETSLATSHSSRDTPALSARELEVLRLIAEGLPNKQIAARLGISDHTVKFHVGSVFAKLHASSRAEAVVAGARGGLIVL